MKSYIPIIITVSAVVIVLITIMVITPQMELPQDRLNQQIDEKIEMAKRMLVAYQPGGMYMSAQLASPATQPENIPPDQWQEKVNYVKQESPFAGQFRQMQQEINRLDQLVIELGKDTPSPATAADARDGYLQLNQQLQNNEKSIAEALDTVRQAVQMSVQDGEQTITGSSHPIATRMEAVLSYSQADLLRRRASIYQALADEDRARFLKVLSSWRHIDSSIRSLERNITSSPDDHIEPTTRKTVADQPKPVTKTGGPTLFGKVLRKMFEKDAGGEKPQKDNIQPEAEVAEQPATQPAEPAAIAQEQLPTLQERIDSLQTMRKKVVTDIDGAKTNADKLAVIVKDLEQQIATEKGKAGQAEQKMMALSSAGIDPADPKSLDQFVAEYNATAEIHREASREATVLEKGAVRNARPYNEDEAKKPSEPLDPIDPHTKLAHERGLIAIQGDLRIAQGMVETNTALLSEIDKQIEEFTTRQMELTKRLEKLKTSREELRKQAAALLKSAIEAVVQADKLETEALDLAANQGMPAAVRAQGAANKRINEARTNKDPEATDTPLDMIIKDQFIGGHLETLEGDLQHMIAIINTQRRDGFKRHQWMIERTEQMGIKIDKDLLPESIALDNIPKAIIQSSQAAETIKQATDQAIQAGEKALEVYNRADSDLKQLWVLHTNIASVHYLLASLTTGKQAQQHRDMTIKEYQRSIKDRADRPEAKVYQHIIDGLTKAQQ